MDKTKRDLESIINSQKEQLTRYEKRLKDVVTAYKGLLKEKEALELSLSAITERKPEDANAEKAIINEEQSEVAAKTPEIAITQELSNLQTQIITLMNSLATLSAEKSRMEASFQADKKQLRALIAKKEENINELQTKIKDLQEKAKTDVDEVKAKWIIERQEREKETNNQMLMIRELQKLYADERHLKESIEMQLNNFKTQFASKDAENTSLKDLQIQLKDAKQQLKQLQSSKSSESFSATQESSQLLLQVQQEMHQLKEQHAVAIRNEQKRVQLAEEQSRKQSILHEDRVANLEARLAELSDTVGTYDRLRQHDQDAITSLRRQVQDFEKSKTSNGETSFNELTTATDTRLKRAIPTNNDISTIVEEVLHLKKLLLQENFRSRNPIDLSKLFSINSDHTQCQEEIHSLLQQLDASKAEQELLLEKLRQQQTHIATLQEKVIVLNRNIDEQEIELKHFNEKLHLAVQEEREKWKSLKLETENEHRCKFNEMEQQLQKQRQRSLQLLDEKEQEIKALQTSFEIFHSANISSSTSHQANVLNLTAAAESSCNAMSSDAESADDVNHSSRSTKKLTIKAKKLSMGESCHMLHYANEIARKDIEIVNLRKSKYQTETAMRKAIQDKVNAQEELNGKIEALEEQVDRLERCKTREGANLEYLKNVIISYIVSKDADGKRHMMNAISAVLQFTPAETLAINNAFLKK